MDNLHYKYRTNQLTSRELIELRKKINSMSDQEIEQEIEQTWLREDLNTNLIENKQLEKIKSHIDKSLGRSSSKPKRIIYWGQIAAAILFPVFILLTFYLYRENRQIISEEMIVTTGKGERATIILPDGTTVSLNSDSQLGYTPKIYNKKERKINFNGEGYFQVCKDQQVPFLIDAPGLQVKILGTTFNLLDRESSHTAELALEEGSVLLTSTKSNQEVTLKHLQKAILNKLTGNITVITDENLHTLSAWRKGEMVFRNTALSHVIKSVENHYNVTITLDCSECMEDKFTGNLPVTNLNEVLEVFEKSYYLKATITGHTI
ncbi:MAG: FecR domain-containing protein [Bacteroides sp.]|nr:FecR domain-containing protein [Bacteroides sp.]